MLNLVTPYNEHYMNCYLNNFYSIICSKNYYLKSSSYNNNFHYLVESDDDVSYLLFDYSQDLYFKLYELIFDKKIKGIFDIFTLPLGVEGQIAEKNISDIEQGLLSKNVVFLLIDLFYFNNGNIFYNRIHREHYMLIVGYDSIRSEYIILDDGNKGYGEYRITLSEINNLLKHDKNKAYFYELSDTYADKTDYFQLNIDTIKDNAVRIEKEIVSILEYFPKVTIPFDYTQHCNLLMFIQRSFNREISNKYLINYLETENKNISLTNILELNKSLVSNWYNLRARILKYSALGKKIEYEPIYAKMERIFYDEINFWSLIKSL